MELKTKYNLGDRVYSIRRHGYNGFKACKTCNGVGLVTIKETEKSISCPTCYGKKGKDEYIPDRWAVCDNDFGQIGKVTVEKYHLKYTSHENKIQYMLDSTGVGSGTCWKEEDLFLTVEEAEKECDLRNTSVPA